MGQRMSMNGLNTVLLVPASAPVVSFFCLKSTFSSTLSFYDSAIYHPNSQPPATTTKHHGIQSILQLRRSQVNSAIHRCQPTEFYPLSLCQLCQVKRLGYVLLNLRVKAKANI
jgi:hypothetical protein